MPSTKKGKKEQAGPGKWINNIKEYLKEKQMTVAEGRKLTGQNVVAMSSGQQFPL